MKILLATTNEGKRKEMQEILSEIEFITLKDILYTKEVQENGNTFYENARKKAKQIYEDTKIPCLADDSGIAINQYHGWPGVNTARFLGKDKATNEFSRVRNEFILEKMKDLPKEKRKVENITSIVYYDGKKEYAAEGKIQGYIAQNCRGDNGFGFDEIFELDNGKTLAELTKIQKNEISSRRKALEKIREKLFFEK